MRIKCPLCDSVVKAKSGNLQVYDFSVTDFYGCGTKEKTMSVLYKYHCPICWHQGKIERKLSFDDCTELFREVPFIETLKKIRDPRDAEMVAVEDDAVIEAIL